MEIRMYRIITIDVMIRVFASHGIFWNKIQFLLSHRRKLQFYTTAVCGKIEIVSYKNISIHNLIE